MTQPLKGIHHSAYRCSDAEQTRAFYEDILGFPLAAALEFDEEPGSKNKQPFVHLFFRMPDGNYIAFFDAPDTVTKHSFRVPHGFDRHVAFEAESVDAMMAYKAKLEAAGKPAFGPIDHGFVQSVYFWDPDGLPLEITTRVADHDTIMAHEARHAREVITNWTVKTAEQKARNKALSA